MRIEPAELAFDANGTPFAPAYGDVYHSADSGPGQARHVFLGGNDLPRRWAGARVYTILETGFGLGLNFLATWSEWRDDPQRPQRLHFVSIEKHPFGCDALAALHERCGAYAGLAAQLRDAWPPLTAGLHRLHFENERVTLTLAFADVTSALPQLTLCADAIYLDGFAPRCNPEMWSPQLMKRLARLARVGTTLATYSTAGVVRSGLEAAGFALEKRRGFGAKREMLCATYAPRWPVRSITYSAAACAERHAIVIGAGLAGAAVSERLALRGWRIDLIERRTLPAAHVPGSYAGVFHPHVSRDDCILSRATRNGFLYAAKRWSALQRAGHALSWAKCGLLQLAGDSRQERRMRETAAAAAYPGHYARYVVRAEAEALAGCGLRAGGWWFAEGGWMHPLSLIAAQLAAASAYGAGSRFMQQLDTAVHALARVDAGWQALAADGSVIATAPVIVLANSNDVARLATIAQPLRSIRGQVTYLPAQQVQAPRVAVSGSGYVLPAVDGVVVTGSTYDFDDADPALQESGHAANLLRLAQLLPDAHTPLHASMLDGAVGFRCASPDHMPVVGALPDVHAAHERRAELSGAHLAQLPRRAGLYCVSALGSRGLVWAALAGEMIASLIEGEPLPVESDLAGAMDPGRFVLRQARSGML